MAATLLREFLTANFYIFIVVLNPIPKDHDSGSGFLWMPGEEPVMFDDRKSVIRLRVKDHIPYLETNDEMEHGPLGKLTESAIGVLDSPEDCAVNMSGGSPIAVPAEEPR